MKRICKLLGQENGKTRVAFLTGAGISVASGIPDFRSAGGLYDTLQPELLTASKQERLLMSIDPTNVVSWDIFENNPFPYLEVRRPFILGMNETSHSVWKPTLCHWFIKLLDNRKFLLKSFTQNIDGIDYQMGIDDTKIISVHGTLARASCEGCGTSYPFKKFQEQVRKNIRNIYYEDYNKKTQPEKKANATISEQSTSTLDGKNHRSVSNNTGSGSDNDFMNFFKITPGPKVSKSIPCLNCSRPLVKPSTVLYGRNLPDNFIRIFDHEDPLLENIDILFIVGTSLTVSPACNLIEKVPKSCLRVLINDELVGTNLGFGDSDCDIWLKGKADKIALDIISNLGWMDDLLKYKDRIAKQSLTVLENYMKKEKN
eukprot:g3728.t1